MKTEETVGKTIALIEWCDSDLTIEFRDGTSLYINATVEGGCCCCGGDPSLEHYPRDAPEYRLTEVGPPVQEVLRESNHGKGGIEYAYRMAQANETLREMRESGIIT